ncbi:MAG: hypothetical protein U0746_10210 [Gemmataceae bacterium]
MWTGKNGRPKADPAEELAKLLVPPESNDIEAAPWRPPAPDDEAPEVDDDAPDADHVITTLAVIVLDVSGSVYPYADEVTGGFNGLSRYLRDDSLTAFGVRLSLVNTWLSVTPFVPAADFVEREFRFGSSTPLGRATSRACEQIEDEMAASAAAGRPINKIMMAVITDGIPKNESPAETRKGVEDVKRLRKGRPPLNVITFKCGPGEPGAFLRAISGSTPVIHASEPETGYREIFKWLASAIRSASESQPGEVAEAPDLTAGLRFV